MKNYSKLLNLVQEDSIEDSPELNDRVILIDAMNMFLRSFAVINKINKKGNHIGGLVGFLKSIGAMVELIQPTRVIVIFDGKGNITNKKNIFSDYKGTRKIKRITNWDSFDSLQEESESIENQLIRLIDYLKCLPINISIIDKLEADDVIAYTAPLFKSSIIVSADQDFLQLVSKTVTVYSPIKKKYYTPSVVEEEFGLKPKNFLNMKVLLGDTSDNVPKVPKLGVKKLFKLFPELSGDKRITLDEIVQKSYDLCDDIPLYGNIYNFRKQLYINEKLMDLETLNISEYQEKQIKQLIVQKPNQMNSTKFLTYYNKDKLDNSIYNVTLWLRTKFGPLDKIN